MKNKKLNYFLIAAVIVVWGFIIYRIVGVTDKDSNEKKLLPATNIKEPFNDYSAPKDTSRLLLNYRDPFGMMVFKDTVKAVGSRKTSGKVSQLKPEINWGFVKYSGYIRNSENKQLIALLQINGRSAEMKEGDSFEKVTLLRNMRDSVKIRFNGNTKYITIQHG